MSPALAGGFLTTVPPGKYEQLCFNILTTNNLKKEVRKTIIFTMASKINKTLRNKLNQVGERYVKLQDLDERNLRRYK